MIIDGLNLNHLRIFECVFRTKSMTAASQELHLTQSGVSQHIKAFEEALDVKLFDRINQKVIPTAVAEILFEHCSLSLKGLEQVFSEIQLVKKQLAGRVTLGMPIEFGNNVVLPLISRFSKKHPLIKFHFRLGFAQRMNEMLLNGEIDFAFVDDLAMDRKVATARVYDEILELCALPELLKKTPISADKKFFESLEYVEYQRDEEILRKWFGHHIGSRNLRLNVKATIIDVQGVARLIQGGAGAGVLPGHLVLKLQREGQKLYTFKGCGKPLKNTISLAWMRERTQTPAAQASMDWLKNSLN